MVDTEGYQKNWLRLIHNYQSMTGIQNHLEKEVMDTQVTHLHRGLGTASTHIAAQSIIIMCCEVQFSSYKFFYFYCKKKSVQFDIC